MSTGGSSDAELIRREYETSLSWRITRPLRAAKRRARGLRDGARAGAPGAAPTAPGAAAGRHDSWLECVAGERLSAIESACADRDPSRLALFGELDSDLWALLLTQQQRRYPNIAALLPDVPDPALQRLFNGASGETLATQTKAFYDKLRARYARHGERELGASRVLDFGCGWGRITRYLARDVEPGRLYGCDPVQRVLDICRETRVPAKLARTDFLPREPPFAGERFDLAFSFSVFTHISEAAHEACLRALHGALRPGGILVVTVRPPAYLWHCELMRPQLRALGADPATRLREPRYLFAPHAADPSHLQYEGGEMTYGETVITLPYVRERWSPEFELLDADLLIGDLHQVVLTLRRKG